MGDGEVDRYTLRAECMVSIHKVLGSVPKTSILKKSGTNSYLRMQ